MKDFVINEMNFSWTGSPVNKMILPYIKKPLTGEIGDREKFIYDIKRERLVFIAIQTSMVAQSGTWLEVWSRLRHKKDANSPEVEYTFLKRQGRMSGHSFDSSGMFFIKSDELYVEEGGYIFLKIDFNTLTINVNCIAGIEIFF